ncbi:MAG TPA: DUF2785 domain-containing protein, partial [Hellea balneolensis]|nr:DUF2785 domain-containing protein [Hellea balneolensis]
GGQTLADMTALKMGGYTDLPQVALDQIALNIVPCIGHPNPEIRDGLVYETYAQFLRKDALSTDTKIKLFKDILAQFSTPEDPTSFTRPFAALDLSELVRADRIHAYLSDEQRENLVNATAGYLTKITDYRGFSDTEGWRHGIAHASDLVLQMTLNPKINDQQIETLRAALSTQIAPDSGHAYIHGESERLARPILYMARRGTFTAKNWQDWTKTLIDPAPFSSWNDMYTSEKGLAKLHNTKALLNTLYINANESQDDNVKRLFPAVRDALFKLP